MINLDALNKYLHPLRKKSIDKERNGQKIEIENSIISIRIFLSLYLWSRLKKLLKHPQ